MLWTQELCRVPEKYWEVELRSYIYIGVRDQRVRELIDQLAEDQHTQDRYVEIEESYEVSKSNAQAFQMGQVTAAVKAIRNEKNK